MNRSQRHTAQLTPHAGPPCEFISCSLTGHEVSDTAWSALFICPHAGTTSPEYLGAGEFMFASVVLSWSTDFELFLYTAVAFTDDDGNPDPRHQSAPWIGTPTTVHRTAQEHLFVGIEIGYDPDLGDLDLGDHGVWYHNLARIPLSPRMSVFVLGRAVGPDFDRDDL